VGGRKLYPKASELEFLQNTTVFPFSENDTVLWKHYVIDGTVTIKKGVIRKVHFMLSEVIGTGGCITVDGICYMYGNVNETHFRIEVDGNGWPSMSYVFAKHNIRLLMSQRMVITEKIKKLDIYKR
jgi:hypothetical protein